jgi:hypothetical protein
MRKSQTPVEKAASKPVEKKQNSHGQQSIDVFYTKKSTSNIQQNNKKKVVVTTSNSDEHL